MKTRILLPLAGVVLLGLSGCKTTVNTVENAQPVGQRQMVTDKRVITDMSLNRKVQIVGVNESTGVGGFLKVQIEVLNTTRSIQGFSYRFEWFDADGMEVRTPTSVYIPRQIGGKESIFIGATAPNTITKDFRVKFIENN